MHAGVPSPASVYKSFDHVFIARVLSSSTAQLGIKEIQYLRRRDLVAFCRLARRGLHEILVFVVEKRPLSYTSIRTTDLKSLVQLEMQHRVSVTKTI